MIEKAFEIFWTRTQIQKAIINTTIYQQTTSKGQTQEKNSEAKLHSAKKEKKKTNQKTTHKNQPNTTKAQDILLRRTLTI